VRVAARGDLVDFVEEDDAVLLDIPDRIELDLLVIDQLRRLPPRSATGAPQKIFSLRDFLRATAQVLKHALDLRGQLLHSRWRERSRPASMAPRATSTSISLSSKLAFAQLLAEFLAGGVVLGTIVRVIVRSYRVPAASSASRMRSSAASSARTRTPHHGLFTTCS
jgi:hypothetical protein